jgi:protoheme IX farnesyltransferase
LIADESGEPQGVDPVAAAGSVEESGAEAGGAAPRPEGVLPAPPSLARDLVGLTKPRIISLLLVTTAMPMFVAGRPGWLLVLVVIVGGYLMAGGANAINMYLDRDIDDLMARTRKRPLPSGRMTPLAVLAYGIALATAATYLLARFANVLTAILALTGFYFYVFVYTRWLKRSTPQNIVIGGAAGAFPPLVGWAAVTGRISLAALYLFAIVFYWTPPHFWALAILKQNEYGRAGVPMAPLVWGERETLSEMVWYAVILLPLTLLPVVLGALGWIYFVSALASGALFLGRLLRLRQSENPAAQAWRLYRFSLLYLAVLFTTMAVDRALVR